MYVEWKYVKERVGLVAVRVSLPEFKDGLSSRPVGLARPILVVLDVVCEACAVSSVYEDEAVLASVAGVFVVFSHCR